MIAKLFLRRLQTWQIVVASLALLCGFTGIFLSLQLAVDLTHFQLAQADHLQAPNLLTVQKSLQPGDLPGTSQALPFDQEELENLRAHPTIRAVAPFVSNGFAATAAISLGFHVLQSEVFFESVDDRFVDLADDLWRWQEGTPSVPLLAPLDFLHLYNFGFAASQGFPAMSPESASNIPLLLILRNGASERRLQARIAGFSPRLDTLLVPQAFMQWAHTTLQSTPPPVRRILLETVDNRDPRLARLLQEKGLEANLSKVGGGPAKGLFSLLLKILAGSTSLIVLLAALTLLQALETAFARQQKMTSRLLELGHYPFFLAWQYSAVTLAAISLSAGTACVLTIFLRARILSEIETLGYVISGNFPSTVLLGSLVAIAILWAGLFLRTLLLIHHLARPEFLQKHRGG